MVRDPSWKRTGPPEPDPTDSEHAIYRGEDWAWDFDGFGRDEVAYVDGEPLIVIRESQECMRDGCDAVSKRKLLFSTAALEPEQQAALEVVSDGEPGAYVSERAERVGPESIEVGSTRITADEMIDDPAQGPCFGREDPSPDLDAYRYDGL